jgi:phosphoketolase
MPNKVQTGIRLALCEKSQSLRCLLDAKINSVEVRVVHAGEQIGKNFIYVHSNRVIKKYDFDMIYVAGPGHGGPAA